MGQKSSKSRSLGNPNDQNYLVNAKNSGVPGYIVPNYQVPNYQVPVQNYAQGNPYQVQQNVSVQNYPTQTLNTIQSKFDIVKEQEKQNELLELLVPKCTQLGHEYLGTSNKYTACTHILGCDWIS